MKTEANNKPEQNEDREAEYLEWMQDQGFALAEEYHQMGEAMYEL